MGVSENVNGTENPFPAQTANSAYAMSRVLKEGRKKMVFLFTRPRLWALQLPLVPFKGPPVQARVPIIKVNELSQMRQGSLNRSKSIGFKGNFAGNREIQCDFFVFRNCFTMSCTFVVSVNQTLPGSQWDSRPGAPNPSPRQMWPLIGGQLVESKSNIQCW